MYPASVPTRANLSPDSAQPQDPRPNTHTARTHNISSCTHHVHGETRVHTHAKGVVTAFAMFATNGLTAHTQYNTQVCTHATHMRLVSQTHKSHTHTHPYAQTFTYDVHVTDHDAAVKYNHDGIAYSAWNFTTAVLRERTSGCGFKHSSEL